MTKTTKKKPIFLSLILILLTALILIGNAPPTRARTVRAETAANGDFSTGKTPATPGAQPFMVALVDASSSNAKDGQFCGASLIAPDWVLTAAHCLESTTAPDDVDVVIGRYQLSSNEGERINADAIYMHDGYVDSEDGENNDIALIKLDKPSTIGTPIDVITAANEYVDDATKMARVTGWGAMSENGEGTDKLHGVNVPVVAQAVCKATAGDTPLSTDDLCAGYEAGGKDSCYGDSGGPLTAKDNSGKPVQIGVVSYGQGECGEPGKYGVYIRLTEYQSWLADVQAGRIAATDMAAYADNFGSDDDFGWDDDADWGDWDDSDWEDDSDWSDWDDSDWDDSDWDDSDW